MLQVKDYGAEVGRATLIPAEDFLLSLTAPVLKSLNLAAAWTKKEPAESNAATLIANATSDTGFAITTILTSQNGQPSPIHIIRNGKTDRTLLVGETNLSSTQRRMLEKGNITYICRTDFLALQKIKAFLQGALRAENVTAIASLKEAFLMRSTAANDQPADQGLAELLLTATPKIDQVRHFYSMPVEKLVA